MKFYNPKKIDTITAGINGKYISKSKTKSSFVADLIKVYDATNYWADQVKSNLKKFEVHHDVTWQISGNYKKYTWARIYPKGFANHGVYYTFGIDFKLKVLRYKIDCQRRGKNKLSKEQIKRFDAIMQTKSAELSIVLHKQDVIVKNLLAKYPKGWADLVKESTKFISKSIGAYYNIIDEVWGLQQPVPRTNKISLEDLLKRQERNRIQGRQAEEFVLKFEQKRMKKHPKAKKIEMISDDYTNAGYDIVSFSALKSNNIDRFIEVKSYQGDPHFYWSANEITIAMEKRDQYFLYLVDYNRIKEKGYKPKIYVNPYETVLDDNSKWFKRATSTYFEEK